MKEILRQIREENRYSQNQVAEKLGITRQTYIKYESGDVEPSVDVVRKLSKLYGVSYDVLIDNKVKPFIEYKIPEHQFLKVSDSGVAGISYDKNPELVPVYFDKTAIDVFRVKAKEYKTSLERFLYNAALEYIPESSKCREFDDFEPLNTGDFLADYVGDSYKEEMLNERYKDLY